MEFLRDESDYEDYDLGSDGASREDGPPRVLVVGEKPKVAQSLERALWNQPFLDFEEVEWIFTSTLGHVLDIRPKGRTPAWDRRHGCYKVAEQAQLFEQELETYSKDEWKSGQEWRVEDILTEACGESIDFLLLCLDNDLEGEAIAAEVESFLYHKLSPPLPGITNQVWRCKFSSLDQDSLRRAVNLPPHGSLQEINRNFVEAVAVRRELDLRLGFAFSAAQKYLVWNFLQDRRSAAADIDRVLHVCQGLEGAPEEEVETQNSIDSDNVDHEAPEDEFDSQKWPVLSYGPCQLPTLGFVVKNDVDISNNVPKPLWKIKAQCVAGAHDLVAWSPLFKTEALAQDEARQLRKQAMMQPLQVRLEESTQPGYQKPPALNTPRMLQLASECLGLSPARTMALAEDLYLAELISYPRSETTSYKPEEDLEAVAFMIATNHPISNTTHGRRIKDYAQILVNEGLEAPRQDARDVGDHQPIMPLAETSHRRPTEKDAADLYDLIACVFLASVSPDAKMVKWSVILEVPFGGCSLIATGHRVHSLGWLEVLPIQDAVDSRLPETVHQAAMGGLPLVIQDVSVERFETEPPARLTEGKLLVSMETHGIGTDASMPGHIAKIIERCYVKVAVLEGQPRPQGDTALHLPQHWFRTVRTLHPTLQGAALFRWYMLFGKELALPSVRADVEAAYLQVSTGARGKEDVLEEFIDRFWWQFHTIFDPEEASSATACKTLISFLKQSPEEYQHNSLARETRVSRNASVSQLWQKAERMIRGAGYEELAESRRQGMEAASVHSAPATAPINHCLMIDAQLLDSGGDLTNAVELHVGDFLSAVVVQDAKLKHGQCSVSAVRCFQVRERDVAKLSLCSNHTPSVEITSNHSMMAKHRASGDLSWGPVVARDLSTSHVVLFDDRATSVADRCDAVPGQSMIASVNVERKNTRVIELEFDSGEAACWLHTSPRGFIAAYGEVPRIVSAHRRHAAVWGFSRCPPDFREALRTSEELENCRHALTVATFSFLLPSGGHMFVRPGDVELVKRALRINGFAPRASEVVVSPEFEVRLQESLGLLHSTGSVYRRRNRELNLDTAMGDARGYRNGRPFSYVVGDRVVQGRRTFIDLDLEDTMSASAATASTSDLLNTGYGSNHNPRSHAAARLRRV